MTQDVGITSSTARRTAILVLGMHRSGTSAITRVISLLGADLPKNLMPAVSGNNEPGFWESMDVWRLNDEILALGGSGWSDWRRFKPDWIRSPAVSDFKGRAVGILEKDFSRSSIFVLKDPRICRLLPFWLEVLREFDSDPRCVLALRNPLEVAASLKKRDGFSPAKSHMIWLRHVLDAEYESRGLKRSFVSYDALLDDWRGEVSSIASGLEISFHRNSANAELEIDGFLEKRYRSHVIDDECVSQHPELGWWVKETHDVLHTLHVEPESKGALGRLDAVRGEFDHASDSLGSVLRAELEEVHGELEGVHGELAVARAALSDAVAVHAERARTLEQVAAQRAIRISELEGAAAKQKERARLLEQAVSQHKTRNGELEALLRAEQEQRHAAVALKKQLLGHLDTIQSSSAWQLTSSLRAAESHWPRLVHATAAVPKFVWWTLTLRLPQRFRIRRLAVELLENNLFDQSWYIEHNSDVVLNGRNPLLHWLVTGWTEGRDPNPFFDTDWYLAQNPDVAAAGLNPLAHYLAQGAAAGLDPSPLFDTDWYLAQNPDVAKVGINPLVHYVCAGRAEGRSAYPNPDTNGLQTKSRNIDSVQKELQDPQDTVEDINHDYAILRQDVATSGFWDENWYLSNYYKEFRESEYYSTNDQRHSALDFYLQEGWKRGHKPSDVFVCGNINKSGNNPITYFLNSLRFEGYQFERNVWIPSKSSIDAYVAAKQSRRALKVVYTCILSNYDVLMQPYYIDGDWDYICFTDDEEAIRKKNDGVWEIRKANCDISDSNRNNRWHKIHPHFLFPEYEESIYIDGNINVISSYLYREINRRGSDLLFTQHFCRSCVYDEIEELLRSPRTSEENRSLLKKQREFLEAEHFPRSYGLGENNIIYRKHNESRVIEVMDQWWKILSEYSSRDQAGLAYVMWKQGRSMQEHMFINSRISYKDFWVVRHRRKAPKFDTLTPAFEANNIAVVFSTNDSFSLYLGVAIISLVENTADEKNYDIIVLESDLREESAVKLRALCSGRSNVSLRFLNVKQHLSLFPKDLLHVEGYVPPETYNKCMLTNILIGYERCVYLDSDIVVLDDVAKLHDVDLHGKSIAASLNVANIHAAYCNKIIKNENFRQYVETQLGVLDYRKYFQAGVLVLNLRKLHGMDLLESCISKLEKTRKPVFFDQCIFNSVFYGDVTFFSTAWNHVWYLQKFSYLKSTVPEDIYFDYAHGRIDPKIIHYASKDKPQNKPEWLLANHFWKYAGMTPFFKEILNDCSTKLTESDYELLVSKIEKREDAQPRVLVHLHLFYYDQLDYMLQKLQSVDGCVFDLFVTMPGDDVGVKNRILRQFDNATILIAPNVGYDIYPFLSVLSKVRLDDYDFILKIHTKNLREEGKDEVYSINVPGYQWRDELIDALLKDRGVFNKNLSLLQENKKIGCVGAERFIFDIRDNNEEDVYNLNAWKSKCNLSNGSFYIGGSMFLARSYPFEKLKSMNLRAEDFGTTNLKTKDYKNLAHVLERLFGIIIGSEDYEILGV